MKKRIYLAGPMDGWGTGEKDWREAPLGWRSSLIEISDGMKTKCQWASSEKYYRFTDPDHSRLVYSGPDMNIQHGASDGRHSSYKISEEGVCRHAHTDSGIVDMCFESVSASDMLFALIDRRDQFGTFLEIGAANASRVPVAIFMSNELYSDRDLWFVRASAIFGVSCTGTPAAFFSSVINMIGWDLSLRDMPYAEYLQTDHWRELSSKVKASAGGRCMVCNRKGQLHAHHRTYENRGCEEPGDVIALCYKCHGTFHGKSNG